MLCIVLVLFTIFVFFFKQKTAYDMRISDWSSDVCSSDLLGVSPATIRNDMAALEDEGYITQPHTSAGRVPTDRGYRLFVDRLSTVKIGRASCRERVCQYV